jgi:hypothetical protein
MLDIILLQITIGWTWTTGSSGVEFSYRFHPIPKQLSSLTCSRDFCCSDSTEWRLSPLGIPHPHLLQTRCSAGGWAAHGSRSGITGDAPVLAPDDPAGPGTTRQHPERACLSMPLGCGCSAGGRQGRRYSTGVAPHLHRHQVRISTRHP